MERRYSNCAHAPDVQCSYCVGSSPREVGLDPAPDFFAGTPFKSSPTHNPYGSRYYTADFAKAEQMVAAAMSSKLEKLALNLIPFAALEDVASAFAVGAKKYGPDSWRKGMPYSACASALLRHFSKWQSGEDYDPVDGQPHMAAIAFYTLVILQYERDGRTDLDDRYSRRNND